MTIMPGLERAFWPIGRAVAAAAACLWLGGCAVSGPPTIADTGAIKQAPAAVQDAAPAAKVATDPASSKPSVVKVVMLLPLTGAPHAAALAKGMKQAGELALFDLDNPAVQLVFKDDKGTPEGAKAAAEEAVKDGAELILGPVFSRSVAAAAGPARAAGVPVVAFSNDVQVAGNGVYLLSFQARPEVERIVGYSASQSKKRFAALLNGDAYGQLVDDALREAAARHGGTVVAREIIPADGGGMIEPLQRLSAAIRKADEDGAPVEALLVPGGQESLAMLGPLLATTGIDTAKVKLIGIGGWDLANGGRSDGLVGMVLAGPDPQGWREFAERFVKNYAAPPPRLATLAYEAVSVAVALSPGPPRGRYTQGNLARANGFTGVDGAFRLLPNGLSERALAVLELQKFGVQVVDPAPGSLGNAKLTSAASPLN